MNRIVLVAVDDLFFVSKITATAQALGVPLRFAHTQDELIALALSEQPALLIVDLNGTGCSPLETIAQLKDDADLRHIPIVGFLSHVQADLKVKATMAGCDRVMPRSVFSARLPEILSEYVANS